VFGKETRMSTESTLTSKGQTTVPKAIRESLRLKSGDRITFTLMPDGTVLMRVKNKSVMGLAGSLRRRGRKALPVEDLSR
jgi:antitoxin PrlF